MKNELNTLANYGSGNCTLIYKMANTHTDTHKYTIPHSLPLSLPLSYSHMTISTASSAKLFFVPELKAYAKWP